MIHSSLFLKLFSKIGLFDNLFIVFLFIFFLILIFKVIFWYINFYFFKNSLNSIKHCNSQEINSLLEEQIIMNSRIQSMIDFFTIQQEEIRKKIDGMIFHVGQEINNQVKFTYNNLSKLQEKLSLIDYAQNNIQSLASKILEFQSILSNKQTRGIFGQGRMETIISDSLPFNSYKFQATLSNGTRPDCIIYMPNNAPVLIIDSKFPLESWNEMRDAEIQQKKNSDAENQFRKNMEIHIRDIAKKYFISGETQDTAFLFIPSESIFITIHEKFENLIQKAKKSRITIVSPSLLMLSIQLIQSLLRDVCIRNQENLIQVEVRKITDDIDRLDNRIHKLKNHFQQAEKDLNEILISTEKIKKNRIKIDEIDIKSYEKVNSKEKI